MYMIHLSGQGDIQIAIFENNDIWDWIHCYELDPPEVVIKGYQDNEYYAQDFENIEEILKHLRGYISSYTNDRALSLHEGIEGVDVFIDLAEAMNFISEKNIKISHAWTGYIY